MKRICWIALVILVSWVKGHGRLIEPPSRASAWRYGFDTPHNYNDHELYCGGFSRQWNKNGGKCGVCGDAWDLKTPRPHEYGGPYGQGVIVRRYTQGQVITLRVELTANHFGHFEFSVCPNYKKTSQECLNRNILVAHRPQNANEKNYYYPKDGNKVYEMKYKLPKGLSCAHCLLQWRYIAGNNWGNCPNGTGAVGCGPQEEFRACADISIASKDGQSTQQDEEEEEYNEISEDQDNGEQAKPKPPPYSPTSSLFIGLFSFLAISLALCLIFLHFYPIGSEVKELLKRFAKFRLLPEEKKPPVPPRTRKFTKDDIAHTAPSVTI